jgi:hypothetical protein
MIAAGHFISEFLIFRTVKINRASIWPLLIGSESTHKSHYMFETANEIGTSTVWMYLQKDHYLGL